MTRRYVTKVIRVRPHVRKVGRKIIKVKGYTRKMKKRAIRKKGKTNVYWRPDRGWSVVSLERDRKIKAETIRTPKQPTWRGDLPGKNI